VTGMREDHDMKALGLARDRAPGPGKPVSRSRSPKPPFGEWRAPCVVRCSWRLTAMQARRILAALSPIRQPGLASRTRGAPSAAPSWRFFMPASRAMHVQPVHGGRCAGAARLACPCAGTPTAHRPPPRAWRRRGGLHITRSPHHEPNRSPRSRRRGRRHPSPLQSGHAHHRSRCHRARRDGHGDRIASSGTARAAANATGFYELADLLREDEVFALTLVRSIEALRNEWESRA